MKKVSLVFASLAMVAFVACNNAEEAVEPTTEVVEEVAPVEEAPVVEEVVDTTVEAATEAVEEAM